MASRDPFGIVGTTLAQKYFVESVAGEGGGSVVYRARHRIWQRPVALKAFKSVAGLSEDERGMLLEAFVREGILLAELSERSAAICQARDISSFMSASGEWVPFLVLEWLDGESLDFVLRRERRLRFPPRTLTEAMALVEPVASALASAHKLGVAHRDVKPGNLFVLGDPRGECVLKLLDFGIAHVVTDARRRAENVGMIDSSVKGFTPSYGAPEQFSRTFGATGPWTDVYALALIVVELVAGKEAVLGEGIAEISRRVVDESSRPTPRARGVQVSDAVEAVFARALAVDVASRFQDASEMWHALNEALERRSTRPAAVPRAFQDTLRSFPPSNEVTPPARRRPVRTTITVLALAASLGLAAIPSGTLRTLLRGATPNSAAATPIAVAGAIAPTALGPSPTGTCPPGMARVDGGKLFMGSDDDLPIEKPSHNVTLSPFCIDVFEVTTDDYKACSDRGECKRAPKLNAWEGITAHEHEALDPLCNIRSPETRGRHPINCVDWQMADIYCQARGARLPTEAEWEYAARGSDGRRYPWGDDEPTATLLNACGTECARWSRRAGVSLKAMYAAEDAFEATAPVGSFPAGKSPLGVEDMAGNVWEWVADRFAPYGAAPAVDPTGPTEGPERVVRGGAFNAASSAAVRPTFRAKEVESKRSHAIGFRCARSR